MKKENLLDEIARYCEADGCSPSSLGLWALGNSRFVERETRRAANFIENAATIRAYIANNPPGSRKKKSAAA